jgi:hypothetical protein
MYGSRERERERDRYSKSDICEYILKIHARTFSFEYTFKEIERERGERMRDRTGERAGKRDREERESEIENRRGKG